MNALHTVHVAGLLFDNDGVLVDSTAALPARGWAVVTGLFEWLEGVVAQWCAFGVDELRG